METAISVRGRDVTVDIPVVGEGGTYSPYQDRYPCTVIAVSKSGREVTVQDDDHKVVSGQWPDAKFECFPNPNGSIHTAKLTSRRGRVQWVMDNGYRIWFGRREFWQNPSF